MPLVHVRYDGNDSPIYDGTTSETDTRLMTSVNGEATDSNTPVNVKIGDRVVVQYPCILPQEIEEAQALVWSSCGETTITDTHPFANTCI